MATKKAKDEDTFLWHKPFTTKDGKPARLLGVLVSGDTSQPYIVAVPDEYGNEQIAYYSANGAYYDGNLDSDYDLMNTETSADDAPLDDDAKEYIRRKLGLDD